MADWAWLDAGFALAVAQIILLDILLGGDNAVVIAMACRQLPEHQRLKGIVLGTLGAIALRVVLIVFAMSLLALPYLKLLGAGLLIWIGVKLLVDEPDADTDLLTSERLWAAVRTVIVADLVMSVDNVLAIAGAATASGGTHQLALVVFGLLVSIPIIVGGSQLVLKLMDRFDWLVTLGAMLLGWIAGTMAHNESALTPWLPQSALWHYASGAAGALAVWAVATYQRRSTAPAVQPR